ncbi:DUF5666 domain-containing protein [Herbiconiux sp. P16]|uniref:DUF5666 domain-containing protein n=1 Tax=Herbiconiux wuyangfengii TaxID=3342794 RepID=UPI0035B6AFC2
MTITRTPLGSRSGSLRLGVVLGAVGLAGVLALSACSASGSASDAATPAPTGSAAAPAEGAPAFGGGGVSGEIAAISGSTLQVQDTESQTAVSYSADTAITRTVEGSLSDVTVGGCVTAFVGGAPTSDESADDSGAAASVIISAAVDGACTTGAFAGGGTPPDGANGFDGGTPPTDLPEGMTPPTDLPDGVMPTGAPGAGGGAGFGGLTTGLVTAVSGTGFTVQATAADGTTSTEEVTVDDSTSFTRTESTDSSALVVGACVTAMGEADDKGSVVATSLAVSTAGDNGCSAGFGGQRPGGGQGSAPSGTSGSGS